jgi:hypothetical protein
VKSLVIVRPYLPAIRARISASLARIGYDVTNAIVVPRGTPDDEAISLLGALSAPRALLMPFNAHKDGGGRVSDGLTLMLRIRSELSAFASTHVVMPLSVVGTAGYMLRKSELGVDRLSNHALVQEAELDDGPRLDARLRAAGF